LGRVQGRDLNLFTGGDLIKGTEAPYNPQSIRNEKIGSDHN
jgi:hypothetical protein